MLTRLQVNSTQSTELATCSGANPPRRPLNFRQGSPVVDDNPDEAGGPSSLLASRSSAVSDFSIYKCRNNICKICPKLHIIFLFKCNRQKAIYYQSII